MYQYEANKLTSTSAIEVLLSYGASVNRADSDGATALDYTRKKDRSRVVALLEGLAPSASHPALRPL